MGPVKQIFEHKSVNIFLPINLNLFLVLKRTGSYAQTDLSFEGRTYHIVGNLMCYIWGEMQNNKFFFFISIVLLLIKPIDKQYCVYWLLQMLVDKARIPHHM